MQEPIFISINSYYVVVKAFKIQISVEVINLNEQN